MASSTRKVFLRGLINTITLKASQHGVLEDSTLEERIRLFDSRPRLNDECFTIKWLISMFYFFRHSLNTCIS